MFVVDTKILTYAANADAPEHERCLALLHEWANGPEAWFLTWGAIYEFLRVATHPAVYPNPLDAGEALAFLDDFVSAPSFRMLDPSGRHFDILREVIAEVPDIRGVDVFDLRTVVLMREHGIRRIMTRDRDFARFPFIQAVDPLA